MYDRAKKMVVVERWPLVGIRLYYIPMDVTKPYDKHTAIRPGF